MHEHGVADHILERLLRQPERPANGRPVAVTVLVSEWSGLTREALQASLDYACEHEKLSPIELELATAELLGECPACGRISIVTEELVCPACNTSGVRLCGGEVAIITACRYA